MPLPGSAAPSGFVTESKLGVTAKTLTFKVKKPKIPRKTVLDALQLRGCWINEGVKSIKVTNALGKKLKFKLNPNNGALELKKLLPASFPLKVKATFTSTRDVVKRASNLVALSSTHCKAALKKKGLCEDGPSQVTLSAFSGVSCTQASDFEENASQVSVILAPGQVANFHALNTALEFTLSSDSFLADITDATIVVNDISYFAPDISLANNILSLSGALKDGLNKVSVSALDSQGAQVEGEFRIWAGGNSLDVNLVDDKGAAINDGTISLALGDEKSATQTLPAVSGHAIFQNLPSSTVAITAITPDNRSGFLATTGNAGTATLVMIAFGVQSSVANNDISQGLAGWDVGSAKVSVVPHKEDLSAPLTSAATAAEGAPDQDIVLSTLGQGLQFISRTFAVSPGTKSIEVRYRFQTSEFPGGYFGSKFNDFFNISIRSLQGGGNINDGNSMNALGQGAFDAAGDTAWRVAKLLVDKTGDTVQVQIGVANVADGAYDSSVTVDSIKESNFAISKAKLLDIDDSPLRYVSGDDHPYFDKFTYIHGSIKFEGAEDDSLSDVSLQVLDGTQVVATGSLATAASIPLLHKKFGKSGVVEIKEESPILLFKLFPKEAAALNNESNKSFTLRILASTEKGQNSQLDVGSVDLLVRYKGENRYGKRDENFGGDDWVLPTVRTFANNLGFILGDFSNMNGGFFQEHSEHQDGTSIDVWFDGYNQRNGSTADQIIQLLGGTKDNPVSGVSHSRITRVYVAYSRSDTNSFWNRIRDVILANGRRASNVILPDSKHTTHCHLEVSP